MEKARHTELAVRIVRYISDEPQPGIVACQFLDAEGRTHTLIDKVPIFSTRDLDANDTYPVPGGIRCEVLSSQRNPEGREVVTISTGVDGVESTRGLSEFVVLRNQLSD